MKHIFISDPKSFEGQQWKMGGVLNTITQYFKTQEKPNFSTVFTKYPREAMGLIQSQISKGDADEQIRVYAIGGDDIIFDCLNGIAGLPDVELAIVPYGQANTFARSFGEENEEAMRDIISLTTAPVIHTDIISAGSYYAINGCAIGFTPAIAYKMKQINAQSPKGLNRFTTLAYLFLTTLTSIFNLDITARRYTITIDGKDYSGNYSLISIVNTPFFGHTKAPLQGAMPNDGLLEIILIKAADPLLTFRSLRNYSRGAIPGNSVRLQATSVEIHSDESMWIQTDNDYFLDTSITITLLPEAVPIVTANNMMYKRY